MKIRSDNDTTGFKKISIIDELGASMSYNMATDIRPWSDLSTRLRLKLTKSYTFNMNAVFATYAYELDENGKPRLSEHTTRYSQGKFGRFQGMSQNISYTLDNNKVANFFKWRGGEKVSKKKKEEVKNEDEDDDFERETNQDKTMLDAQRGARKKNAGKAETDEDGYMKFSMPWSLSFG